MGTRDPRVDAYIEKQREFARPILAHLRAAVHPVCPEVEETLKWGSPFFMYHGSVVIPRQRKGSMPELEVPSELPLR